MERSFVVTGAGGGVGRALVDRLVADGGVVALDLDEPALAWIATHPAAARIVAVCGDATDESVTEEAADRAESLAPLAGWVNNAAVFRDAALHTSPAGMVLEIITANLALTLVGCATAVRRLLAAGHGGAIVNVSSHQGQRPVRGAMPYATAKGAVESLTRALAVDHGPDGILGERRRARLDQHGAVRVTSRRPRARRREPDRSGDGPAAPPRPGRPTG